MDLNLLNTFFHEHTITDSEGLLRLKQDSRIIRAIIPVHVQGSMFNMSEFEEIINQYNVFVIEDAAESLGSTFKGKHSGTFGKIGCFSFNGNKIISTGGGGMLVTDDIDCAKRAKHLTTTAKTDPLLYHHDEVGYNYRLVNILAAIGIAQVEQLTKFLKRKHEIADYYKHALEGVGDIRFQQIPDDVEHNGWLFTIRTQYQADLLQYLNGNGIISRPFWMPMNELPMFKDAWYYTENNICSEIHNSCLVIPCSTNILDEELSIVVDAVRLFFRKL